MFVYQTKHFTFNYYSTTFAIPDILQLKNKEFLICLATKDDVNEIGNLLSGVLGVLGVGILLVVVIAIIMGTM